jgi:hypothetical protein
MKHISARTYAIRTEPAKGKLTKEGVNSSKADVLVKGVTTAVVASTIIHTGKCALTTLTRHPLVIFTLGIAAGYLAHKNRKQIISISIKTAELGKDFVIRQNENIKELFAETQEDT